MAVQRLCYVIVIDNEEDSTLTIGDSQPKVPFWYTRSALQNVLQLVGCKVHHAVKISRRVFDILDRENFRASLSSLLKEIPAPDSDQLLSSGVQHVDDIRKLDTMVEEVEIESFAKSKAKLFNLDKDQVAIQVSRTKFVDIICSSLEKYRYVGPSQRDDVMLACRLRERKESVTVLLCGTSGCGKSTLSSLLASRLGITTVVSTDSVRHMMRSFINEKENPLLWASTYHAGEFLDPMALAEAKARKKANKLSLHGIRHPCSDKPVRPEKDLSFQHDQLDENLCNRHHTEACTSDKWHSLPPLTTEQISSKELAVEGYKAQSEMVIDKLDHLITTWEGRRESVVVEGVHLSLNFVMGLMKKHPSVIPFLIYISNEEKHLERFAVRAKYMTLDPSKNKYVKYIKNIRTIQEYLCKRAEKNLVPRVNNTNVDRSVASIHSTIFSCMRKRHSGVSWYDAATNTAKVINDEYCKQCDSNPLGSKGMFRMIQRQGSSGRYMAIVNDYGVVTKAWPFSSSDKVDRDCSSKEKNSTVGGPIYGPMKVCDVEPVNIQFGNFGIGSWPNNIEGTSHARSSNSSRGDPDEESSRYSSTTSSPRQTNGHAKELIEDPTVSESDQEQFDDEESNSSYSREEFDNDEVGGSVTESPARSDEEYDEDEDERMRLDSRKSDSCALSKHFLRTGSIKPSENDSSKGRRFSRFRSMPLHRSRSRKARAMDMLPEVPPDM